MPMLKTHVIKIVVNKPNIQAAGDPAVNVPYPLKVVCNCQFEALARDEHSAMFYANGHAGYQRIMGHKAEIQELEIDSTPDVGKESA